MRTTAVFWAKGGLVGLILLATALNSGRVTAQSTTPSALPLLSSDGLQYVGGFRLPAEAINGDSFSFGGSALALSPTGTSLFASSYNSNVAEVSIPAPVNSGDVNALPFASFLQGFSDPTEGRLGDIVGIGVQLSSIMVHNNRLYGTASVFYDANNNQRVSHFSRSLRLNEPSFSGWSSVWHPERQGFVSGFMAPVPSEWQALLGGTAITGQCCIPIVYRTSTGPAAIAFNPGHIGQGAVSGTPLLYYTLDHATLGSWDNSGPTYGATTQIRGMAVIAGTRTVLYFGRNGLGQNCYGNGTSNQALVGTYGVDGAVYCYDPTNSDKGQHAYPYRYQVWAYDLDDFAAVKAGTKQPWEVVPYGVWPLNFPTPESSVRTGGVAYDAQRQLLYVSQLWADPDGYSSRPVIHVFRLDATAAPTAPAANTVRSVTLSADKAAPQAAGTSITFTAQPAGGVAPYQYKWLVSDGGPSVVAADWSASNRYTWTPATANANYRVTVWVRSAGNTDDASEALTSSVFVITPATTARATSVNLVANRVAPQPPFTPITWTATPTGGPTPHQYKWLVSDGTTTTVAASWSPTNSFVWTPSTANANYQVTVWVRSAGNTADAQETSASSRFRIETAATTVSSVTLSADKSEPQQTGSAIRWSAAAVGGTTPYSYKWSVFDGSGWSVVANWGFAATYAWTPTVARGNYRVRVWVKAAGNPADQAEASAERGFVITAPTGPAVSRVTLTSDRPSPQAAGTTIVFTAQPVGGVGPHQYQWWAFDNGEWRAVNSWNSANTLQWMRQTASPNHQVQVRTRSAGSTNDQGEATATIPFVLSSGSSSSNGNSEMSVRGAENATETQRASNSMIVPIAAAPIAPAPIVPAPIAPAPIVPAPIAPAPIAPVPIAPAPVLPAPIARSPVPLAPVAPTPIAPVPVAPAPVAPVRVAPAPIATVPIATVATSIPAPTVSARTVTQVTLTSDKPSSQAAGTLVLFTAHAVGGVGPYQYQWWMLDDGRWRETPWLSLNTLLWSRQTPDSNYEIAVRVRSAGSTSELGEANAKRAFVLTGGGQD